MGGSYERTTEHDSSEIVSAFDDGPSATASGSDATRRRRERARADRDEERDQGHHFVAVKIA